jgi:hypothetical protein
MKSTICKVLGALVLLAAVVAESPAADEAQGTLKTPQPAAVRSRTNKIYKGTLEKADDKEVHLKIFPKLPASKYRTADVAAIITRDGVYVFNASSKRWEKEGETSTGKESNGQGKDMAPAQIGATPVVAEGTGDSPEDARKDAIRGAVRKVVGAMVLSETVVKNDKLIRDEILTYSDGVLLPDSFKELESKKEDGVWRSKIFAFVVTRKLADRLTGLGVQVERIDGSKLAESVLSRVEARKQATAILRAVLSDLPKALVARHLPVTPRDYIEDRKELRLNVLIGTDALAYARALARVHMVLERVCLGKYLHAYDAKPENWGVSEHEMLGAPEKGLWADSKETFLNKFRADEDRNDWYCWLMTATAKGGLRTGWMCYRLDCDREQCLEALKLTPHLKISMKDQDGKQITSSTVALAKEVHAPGGARWLCVDVKSQNPPKGLHVADNVAIAPMILRPYPRWVAYVPAQAVRRYLSLSEEELRRVKNIICEVEFADSSPSSTRKGGAGSSKRKRGK